VQVNLQTGEIVDLVNQIWQVQDGAADGSQQTAGDSNTVKFNLTNVGSSSDLFSTNITMRNSIPENTALEGDENDIEDMGADGIDIKIIGQFQNVQTGISKIVKWWKEAKFADGFQPGRFGLELDFPTDFNVEPTTTFGYQIANPTLEILYEKKKIVGFTITLRLGGDVKNAL